MKRALGVILLVLLGHASFGQISNFIEKAILPEQISETSGLLFINGRLYTHNDSGDASQLYEIDPNSGGVLRTISITNATHVDWEDIAQDETHVYIGDFGNNSGNRQDLKIYTILKSSLATETSVTAEEISFAYEDQTNFAQQTNSSNFDAEALISYNGALYVFTKNWADLKTNAYQIPITPGTHTAMKVSSFDAQGLVTGAVYDIDSNSIMLCGYDTAFVPFLLFVDGAGLNSSDLFSGGTTRIALNQLEQGSQLEAIAHKGNGTYAISREKITFTINGTPTTFNQKLFEFQFDDYATLSLPEITSSHFNWYPNPTTDSITITSNLSSVGVVKVEVYDLFGKTLALSLSQHISLGSLAKGVYLIKWTTTSGVTFSKKVLKY